MKRVLLNTMLVTSVLILSACNIEESTWVPNDSEQQSEDKLREVIGGKGDKSKQSVEKLKEVVKPDTEFWPTNPKYKMAKYKIAKIINGTTIQLNDGSKFKLLGISTTTSTKYKRIYLKVDEELAIKYMKENYLLKTVYIEQSPTYPKNPDNIDVGYVWVGDKNKLENLNAILLNEGFAITERIDKVTFYDEAFKKIENKANTDEVGLWKKQ